MREHGTWDAHYIDKDGNLAYDWKLDKRYDAYAKGDKSDPKDILNVSLDTQQLLNNSSKKVYIMMMALL